MKRKKTTSHVVKSRPVKNWDLTFSTNWLVGSEAWILVFVRVSLGLIFLWFGVGELWQPYQWSGYVPFVSPDSIYAVVLVLLHGGVLWVLATALILGVASRAAALLGAGVMLQILVALAVGNGLSDTVVRDFGIFCLTLVILSTPPTRSLLDS